MEFNIIGTSLDNLERRSLSLLSATESATALHGLLLLGNNLSVYHQFPGVVTTQVVTQITSKVSNIGTGHAGREVVHLYIIGKTVVTHGAHVDLIVETCIDSLTAHGGVVPELCIESAAVVQVTQMVYGQVVIGQLASALVDDVGIRSLGTDCLQY